MTQPVRRSKKKVAQRAWDGVAAQTLRSKLEASTGKVFGSTSRAFVGCASVQGCPLIVSVPNAGRSKLLLAVYGGLDGGDASRLIEAEREPVDRRSSLAGVVLPAVRAAAPGDWWSCERDHLSVSHSCLHGPDVTGWTELPLIHIERVDERRPFAVGRHDPASRNDHCRAGMALREAAMHRPVIDDRAPLIAGERWRWGRRVMAATRGDHSHCC